MKSNFLEDACSCCGVARLQETKMAENRNERSEITGRRAHMANERTFLAWVRTAIGFMAFGFAVQRFAFFGSQHTSPTSRLSQPAGLILVVFGVVMTVLAFVRFRAVEKALREGVYKPNLLLTTMLTFFVLGMGVLLLVYMVRV